MLCIFRILTTYRYIVYKYFLHLADGLFISMLVSFTMQRFLVWCSSICLFLLLFPLPEETYPKNISKTNDKEYCLYFLQGYFLFQVLYLTLESILSLFFYYVLESIPSWLFPMYMSRFSNTIYWKVCLLPIVYSCLLCHKLIDHISVGSVLFHWAICLFLCQYHAMLINVALYYRLKLGSMIIPALFFYPQDCFVLCFFWLLFSSHVIC